MKKYIILVLAVLSVGMLCGTSRAGSPEGGKTTPSHASNVKTLTDEILRLVVEMDEAADKDDMATVIETATEIKQTATRLKAKTTPQERQQVAVIQLGGEDTYTPGYALYRAQYANEFLVLARVINGETSLANAIQENPSLADDQGVVGYLSGKHSHMNIRYLPIAEAFKRWKNCSYELGAALQEGLVTKSPKGFCETSEKL